MNGHTFKLAGTNTKVNTTTVRCRNSGENTPRDDAVQTT